MIALFREPARRAALLAVVLAFVIGLTPAAGQAQETPTTAPTTTPAVSPSDAPTRPRAADDDDKDDEDEDEVPDDDDEGDGVELERRGFGGSRNVVALRNRSDGRLRVRGRVQLEQIRGSRATPLNLSLAYASCTDCQTFTAALQIVLVRPGVEVAVPINRARSLNVECTRCLTFARAAQYVITVEDPDAVPPRVEELVQALDAELRAVHAESHHLTAGQANARISAVVAQFHDLAQSLIDQSSEATEPTSPNAPATETVSPTATAMTTPVP